MRNRPARLILLLCATATVAFAQTTSDTPAAPPADAAPKPALTRAKDTLSVDFPDEEIRTVLRNVADLFELNLVIPDTLQGKTSIKLRDVTWRQIFKVVLEPAGYTFVEDTNIIKVVTQASLDEEPLSTEVFVFNYARASDIKPSLDALVDVKKGGKIVVDARSNSLVVSERPSAIQRIRPIVLSLDKPTEQVMIETKFIEVTDIDIHNLGVTWSSLGTDFNGGYSVGVTPTAGPGFHNFAKQIATNSVFSAGQFSAIVAALNTLSDTKLVSNPTVVTMNNSEATINVGNEYPIPDYTYNQERGSFEVSGFTYKPIGVNLKVTPQVNAAGFIRLAVEPEVSSEQGVVNFGGAGGAQVPIIGVRKAKTQVTMKDGFTLGLGGLTEVTTQKSKSAIPGLGSIPGLGRLFRSDNTSVNNHNLIVFITARTLRPDGGTVGDVFDPRIVRQMEVKKEDLPGYRDGSDPFAPPVAEAPPIKK